MGQGLIDRSLLRRLRINVTRLSGAIAVLLVFSACSSTGGSLPAPGQFKQADQVPPGGRYIVCLKPGATTADVSGMTHALSSLPHHTYGAVFKGFAAALTPAELKRLNADPRVDFIEADSIVTIAGKPVKPPKPDPDPVPPQIIPWGITRIGADSTGYTGAGIGVAVVDSGIDFSHPDLPNAVDGYNAINPHKSANDDNGHGTHVAGTVGAADNDFGVVGVAPDCTLVAVKVFNRDGWGYTSDIAKGIDWVAANQDNYNIKVINYSGTGRQAILKTAMTGAADAGLTVVQAAENDHYEWQPGELLDCIFDVSALNRRDGLAGYSNYGTEIDFIAPGTLVLSTQRGGGYVEASGTSMAAPHVAGAAALYIEANPTGADGNPVDFWDVQAGLLGIAEPAPDGGWPEDHPDPPTLEHLMPLVYVAELGPPPTS